MLVKLFSNIDQLMVLTACLLICQLAKNAAKARSVVYRLRLTTSLLFLIQIVECLLSSKLRSFETTAGDGFMNLVRTIFDAGRSIGTESSHDVKQLLLHPTTVSDIDIRPKMKTSSFVG